jgi:hypothetical protein
MCYVTLKSVLIEESWGPKQNRLVLSKALHPSSFHCCQPQDPSHVFVLPSLLALCARLCALPLVFVCPKKLLKERATNQGVTRPACELSLSNLSQYEGLTGCLYNFQQHPIAPVGAKVLTWDSSSHRGTWADHGVEAVYLGPAENHLRAFEVWVPNTSAPRVTNTVWRFLHDDIAADTPLLNPESHLAYPPSKARPEPRDNGSDLIGRTFFELLTSAS